jgi:RecA-family ATPase
VITLQAIARAVNGKIVGQNVRAPSPGHSRSDDSLAITLADNAHGFIVYSHSPAHHPREVFTYVLERLKAIGHEPPQSNGVPRRRHTDEEIMRAVEMAQREPPARLIAAYDYKDAAGVLRYQRCRLEPKSFRFRRPDGAGGWIRDMDGVQHVLYRWPELIEFPDATTFVCEGEKDTDGVRALDLTATTTSKWTHEIAEALRGRHVYIIQDVDENGAGDKKADEAARWLHDVAASIKVVKLPGLDGTEGKKDVSDWLGAGHTKAELESVCAAAPYWIPDVAMPAPAGDASTVDTRTALIVAPSIVPAVVAATPAKAPLIFVKIEDWIDRDPPPREWAVPDRFPLRNVSLLSGEGSTGKSILLMQLAAAHVIGRSWLDTLPEPGDAIYLNAEDEADELHRRMDAIARWHNAPLADFKDQLHILSLAGQDAVLGHEDRNGLIKPTPLFHQLVEAAGDIKPKFIGLDTSADVFAGAENDRSQVRQFIGLLRGMAIAGNSAVIVCAHPSLTGINTGTGLSGSTAWHNSVRARAYLHSVTVDNTEPDKTLRQLDFMKSNYSAIADSITLRWKDGVFVPEPKLGSLEKVAAETKADEAFLQLLKRFTEQGRHVSATPTSPTYAPAVFAKEGTVNKAQLADAMRRLFSANKIRVETYGRPSRPYQHIVVQNS